MAMVFLASACLAMLAPATAIALVGLPVTCGPDGVVRLQPGATYGAWAKPPELCKELRGAQGAHVLLEKQLDMGNVRQITGPLTFRGGDNLEERGLLSAPGGLTIAAPNGTSVLFQGFRKGAICSRGQLTLYAPSPTGRIAFAGCRNEVAWYPLQFALDAGERSEEAEVRDCAASGGGAILGLGGVNLVGPGEFSFEDCDAQGKGGAVLALGAVVMQGASFVRCRSQDSGGAVSTFGEATLFGSGSLLFEDCSAREHGGAIQARSVVTKGDGNIGFKRCGARSGGAISARRVGHGATGELAFVDCSASHMGGAMVVREAAFVSKGGVAFANCTAGRTGGAILAGAARFEKGLMHFDGCRAAAGPGVWAENVSLAGVDELAVAWQPGDAVQSFIHAGQGVSGVDVSKLALPGAGAHATFSSRSPLDLGECSNSSALPALLSRAGSKCMLQEGAGNCPAGMAGQYTFHPVEKVWKAVGRGCSTCEAGHVALHPLPLNDSDSAPERCVPCRDSELGAAGSLCPGGSTLRLPPGAMLPMARPLRLDVQRCAVRKVCRGEREVFVDFAGALHGAEAMCELGYDSSSDGCLKCSPGFGREGSDPLLCEGCPEGPWRVASTAFYVGRPLLLLGLSEYAAMRAAEGDPNALAGKVKIALSFGTLASLSFGVLPESRSFQQATADFMSWLAKRGVHGAGDAQEARSRYSDSPDCLAGSTLSLVGLLFVTLAVPLASLLLLAIASAAVGKPLLLRSVLAWQNLFYPLLTSAFASFLPCISTQPQRYFNAYEFTTACHDSGLPPLVYLAVGILGPLFLVATGPGFWLWLLLRRLRSPPGLKKELSDSANSGSDSEESPEDYEQLKRAVAFLTAGYKPEYVGWEACVLLRKMALAFICARVPPSYAPARALICMLAVLVLAQAAHYRVRPYSHLGLGRLEACYLGVGLLCLLLASMALSGWWNESEPYFWFFAGLLTLVELIAVMGLVGLITQDLLPKDGGSLTRVSPREEESEDDPEYQGYAPQAKGGLLPHISEASEESEEPLPGRPKGRPLQQVSEGEESD